jgi:hypothetical protein
MRPDEAAWKVVSSKSGVEGCYMIVVPMAAAPVMAAPAEAAPAREPAPVGSG